MPVITAQIKLQLFFGFTFSVFFSLVLSSPGKNSTLSRKFTPQFWTNELFVLMLQHNYVMMSFYSYYSPCCQN